MILKNPHLDASPMMSEVFPFGEASSDVEGFLTQPANVACFLAFFTGATDVSEMRVDGSDGVTLVTLEGTGRQSLH